jgi:hypothetical protein
MCHFPSSMPRYPPLRDMQRPSVLNAVLSRMDTAHLEQGTFSLTQLPPVRQLNAGAGSLSKNRHVTHLTVLGCIPAPDQITSLTKTSFIYPEQDLEWLHETNLCFLRLQWG